MLPSAVKESRRWGVFNTLSSCEELHCQYLVIFSFLPYSFILHFDRVQSKRHRICTHGWQRSVIHVFMLGLVYRIYYAVSVYYVLTLSVLTASGFASQNLSSPGKKAKRYGTPPPQRLCSSNSFHPNSRRNPSHRHLLGVELKKPGTEW